MTNDELEAVRARASDALTNLGDPDNIITQTEAARDAQGLLDEVEAWVATAVYEAAQRREAEARATRAEAHAERLAEALGEAEQGLVLAKREIWDRDRQAWTMADWKEFPAVRQIQDALEAARSALSAYKEDKA